MREDARGADADGGRFPCAVRAEQSKQLALFHEEVDAIHRGNPLILVLIDLAEAGDGDDHDSYPCLAKK
jgi:hypothetical protein